MRQPRRGIRTDGVSRYPPQIDFCPRCHKQKVKGEPCPHWGCRPCSVCGLLANTHHEASHIQSARTQERKGRLVRYEFKAFQEIGWAVAVGGGIFIFEVLSQFEPEVISDWETWAVSVGGGLVRAAFAAGLIAGRKLLAG